MHPSPAEVSRDAPNRVVRRLVAVAGIELVDVLDWCRAWAQGPALCFAVDPHLTAAGHRLVAEASLRWLVPGVVHSHPRVEVLSVEPAEQAERMAGSMLGAALQYVDAPWVYRLRRNLTARFVSAEFDVAFATNDAGLRGPALQDQPGLRIPGLGTPSPCDMGSGRPRRTWQY